MIIISKNTGFCFSQDFTYIFEKNILYIYPLIIIYISGIQRVTYYFPKKQFCHNWYIAYKMLKVNKNTC